MKVSELDFIETHQSDDDTLYGANTEFGRITVLHRRTGFGGGLFDTETGYRSPEDKFWLASGMFDIRVYPDLEIQEAIDKIKEHANTCVGI